MPVQCLWMLANSACAPAAAGALHPVLRVLSGAIQPHTHEAAVCTSDFFSLHPGQHSYTTCQQTSGILSTQLQLQMPQEVQQRAQHKQPENGLVQLDKQPMHLQATTYKHQRSIHAQPDAAPAALRHTARCSCDKHIDAAGGSRLSSLSGVMHSSSRCMHSSSSSSYNNVWSSWGGRRSFNSSTGSGAPAAVAQQLNLEQLRSTLDASADESQALLTPGAVVERLNRVIVGQEEAKKAVAIAFRNRWRRQRVADPEMRQEISPKNLLLIGPTGCGKTEIARRLAKLAEAPFIKVEATKFTEVGYYGRDVDSIVRDLVEVAKTTVKARWKRASAKMIAAAVESHILHAILGEGATLDALATASEKYRAGELEDVTIEVELPSSGNQGDPGGLTIQGGQVSMSISIAGMFAPGGASRGREKRSMTVAEARPHLEEAETDRQLPEEVLTKEAIRVAEQEGIVFIDEIDKIVNPSNMLRHGSDPSAEGVQRDLLPLIEGSVVSTKHGPVSTDHMLFIASGAFTSAKPSDMMAELQGRLPIRVELKGLTAADFECILTEPECNMIYQQQQLLGCEGLHVEFTSAAIRELAAIAEQINKEVDNIGARRLHTVIERLVEEISFEAPDIVAEASAAAAAAAHGAKESAAMEEVRHSAGQAQGHGDGSIKITRVITDADVRQKLSDLLKQQDFSKFIL